MRRMNRGKTERLLNLVFAMMATNRAISREEVRSTVAGYEQCASDDAFERMFERDKDELRSMGVPIETITNAFEEVVGYRISPDNYRLIDLELNSRDLEILSVATKVWDQAVLGFAANTAVLKFETHSDVKTTRNEMLGVTRVRAEHAAFLPLLTAAREGRVVSFPYKAAGQAIETRTFEPWSVVCRSGLWYTIGFDQVRKEQRTFKLARIQGAVKLSAKKATHAPPRTKLSEISAPKDDLPINACIHVKIGHGAMLRRHAKSIRSLDGLEAIEVTAPISDLTTWVLKSLPEIEHVEPEELRLELIEIMGAIESDHHD